MIKKTLTFLLCLTVLAVSAAEARKAAEIDFSGLQPGKDYVPGQVLVKLIPELQNANASVVLQEYQLGFIKEYKKLGWQLLEIPEERENAVMRTISELQDDPRVLSATPDYYRHLEWEPNDGYFQEGHLWNFIVTNMPAAWDLDTEAPLYGGDPDVVIAIIDSGVSFKDWTAEADPDPDNPVYTEPVMFGLAPDLTDTNFFTIDAEIWGDGIDNDGNGYVDDRHGYNFAYSKRAEDDSWFYYPYPSDDNEHGTHVCGTIAQSTNNDPGGELNDFSAAGMAFNCTIMPLKSGGRDGTSRMSDVAEAIIYAADNGAHVINMSLGSGYVGAGPASGLEFEACNYAEEAGVLICSSTGNDADQYTWNPRFFGIGYPAGYPSVIAVQATKSGTTPGDPYTEDQASYSQFGYTAEVMGPAGDFYPTGEGDNDNSGKIDQTWQQTFKGRDFPDLTHFKMKPFVGTSMSCPHVAGQLGLILSYSNQMGWDLGIEEIRNKVAASCFDINVAEYPGYDYNHGFGRIDVAASLTIDPVPEMVVRQAKVAEAVGQGNGNFRPEAGETVSLVVDLMPLLAGATGITATISTTSQFATITNGTVQYPDTAGNQFSEPVQPATIAIAANCPLQQEIEIQAVLNCDQAGEVTRFFHVQLTPAPILFWMDDRYGGKSINNYKIMTDALTAAGVSFEVFNTSPKYMEDQVEQYRYPWEDVNFTEFPTYDDLKMYDVVFWYNGQTGRGVKELVADLLPVVVDYIDNGGNMMFGNHEFLYNMIKPGRDDDDLVIIDTSATENPEDTREYSDWFVNNYVKIKAVEHDNWYEEIFGTTADPLTIGMNQSLDKLVFCTNQDYDWWPDNLIPQMDAQICFRSGPPVFPGENYPGMHDIYYSDFPVKLSERACGIRWDDGTSRVVFTAFPTEALSDPAAAVVPLLNWLQTGVDTSDRILVDVETSQRSYTYNDDVDVPFGDTFSVFGQVYNPDAPVTAQRWVLMQISTYFWCLPSFVALEEGTDHYDVVVPTGFSSDEYFTFEWPDISGELPSGIFFWMAHLDSGNALIGDYDFTEWGYY